MSTDGDLGHLTASSLAGILSAVVSTGEPTGSAISAASGGEASLREALNRRFQAREVDRLWDAIASDGAALDELRSWKERLKTAWKDAEGSDDRGAIMVCYHATVARALASHRTWISERRGEQLVDLYGDLARLLAGASMAGAFEGAAASEID